MVSFGEQVSIPDDQELTYELAGAIQVLLDPSSAPSKITESHALISGTHHWLAHAFGMENGRKVLKSGAENAERRLQSDDILGKVDAKGTSLRDAISECETGKYPKSFGTLSLACDQWPSDYFHFFLLQSSWLTISSIFIIFLQLIVTNDTLINDIWFDKWNDMIWFLSLWDRLMYLSLRIVDVQKLISTKEAKQLKGADKEKVSNLSESVTYAVNLALECSVAFEVVPYLNNIIVALKASSKMPVIFSNCSPTLHLRDKAFGSQMFKYLETRDKLHANISKLDDLSTLTAVDSQKILVQWDADSRALLSLFPETAPDNSTHEPFYMKLRASVAETGSTLTSCLQGNVHSETHIKIVDIIGTVGTILQSEALLEAGKEDTTAKVCIDKFGTTVESCDRLTSVLGDEGQKVRNGVKVLEAVVLSAYNFRSATDPEKRDSVEKLVDLAELAAIKVCRRVFNEKRRETSVNELSTLFKMVSSRLSPDSALVENGSVNFLDQMIAKSQACSQRLADSLTKAFTSAESRFTFDLDLPEVVQNVSTMADLVKPEVAKAVKNTFAPDKSQAIVSLAVELEAIETSLTTIEKETGIKPSDFVQWFDNCKHLRCRLLAWLSETQVQTQTQMLCCIQLNYDDSDYDYNNLLYNYL